MKNYGFDREKILTTHGEEILGALSDFYSLYTGDSVKWIASLWDEKTGGFYFSPSARDTDGYLPDIESTGQALGVLQDLGITPDPVTFPEPFVTKTLTFLRELQDEDGFFYQPQWGKDVNTSRRARDLASASGWLKMLGWTTKYPTAIEQMKSAAKEEKKTESVTPEHLRSKEAFLTYLDGLRVNENSYGAGQIIAMQSPQIAACGLSDTCIEYLNSMQMENGIWERELNYSSANGMLKICHAYNALGRDLPRLEAVVNATVSTIFNPEPPKAIVDVFNPLMALHYLRSIVKNTGKPERLKTLECILKQRAVEVIRTTKEKLLNFWQPDTSFCYYPVGYSFGDGQWSQGKVVAPPADEGNMNAHQLGNACRILITEALGLEVGLPYTVEDGKEIFSILS